MHGNHLNSYICQIGPEILRFPAFEMAGIDQPPRDVYNHQSAFSTNTPS